MAVLLVNRAVARLRAADRRGVQVPRAAPARRVATVRGPEDVAEHRGPATIAGPQVVRSRVVAVTIDARPSR